MKKNRLFAEVGNSEQATDNRQENFREKTRKNLYIYNFQQMSNILNFQTTVGADLDINLHPSSFSI
ncbi:MAG: hypothetical protein WBA93_23710 [Microcoleaceae cyanobacterium]